MNERMNELNVNVEKIIDNTLRGMINARVNAYELICCLSTVKHYKISPGVDDAFVVLYLAVGCSP